MAIFRNVNMNFWTDTRIVDDYTPEDRYFMLYALTNSYTNIIGCYEISIKQMSNDLGYTKDVIESLVTRFNNFHKTIEYDFKTKELFVKNWSKYNWSVSPKLDQPLYKAICKIKSNKFHDELAKIYNDRETVEDSLYIPYRYSSDTTNSNSNRNSNSYRNSNRNSIHSDDTLSVSYKSSELEKRFEALWKQYPKKVGKPKALTAYKKAIKSGVTDEVISQGIEGYKKYLAANTWQSPANGQTWFMNERWNDDNNVSMTPQVPERQEYKDMNLPF